MKLLNSPIGCLRIISFAEGMSLLLLLFIAMPLKYGWDYEQPTAIIGAIHGGLFILFVVNTLWVWIGEGWKFWQTTWKVLLSCILPFATFYVDRKILKPAYESKTR